MFDCHIHTKFSADSEMNIEQAIKKSQDINAGIIITDHIDLNYPAPNKFVFDVDSYFKEYSKYRNDNLLLGVEIGMGKDIIEGNNNLVNRYPFDQVIGSIHLVNGLDPYLKEYYQGRSKKDAFEEYLLEVFNNIKLFTSADTLGHIDYISRYAAFEDKELYYDEHSEIIDEILKEIIKSGRVIELNTRRFKSKKAIESLLIIYKRYSELGGEIITVGSDAHTFELIGDNFNYVKEFCEYCGLRTAHFKERKAIVD